MKILLRNGMTLLAAVALATSVGVAANIGLKATSDQNAQASQNAQRAPKPAANPRATVIFLNGTSDNIQGDGLAYVGGVGGVTAELQIATIGSWTGPNRLWLQITNSGKNRRYVLFKYPEGAKVDLSGQPNSSPYPCNYYPGASGPTSPDAGVKVATFGRINSLGQMQVGEARAVRAEFGSDQGPFLWLSPHNYMTGSCSSTLIAYRDSQTTWHVATDITRIPGATELSEADGVRLAADGVTYEVRGTDVSWWDSPSAIAQLGTAPSLGNYRMPFAVTISVPSCPAPPPCAVKPCTIGF